MHVKVSIFESLYVGIELKIAQQAMEKTVLRFSLRDRIQDEEIHNRTKITDRLKWPWVARRTDNRWVIKALEWRPQTRRLSDGTDFKLYRKNMFLIKILD